MKKNKPKKKEEYTTNYTGGLPHKTKSFCPVCKKIIPAIVFQENGKIWISKKCPKHGTVKDVYWEDAEMYEKARKYGYDGPGIKTQIQARKPGNAQWTAAFAQGISHILHCQTLL